MSTKAAIKARLAITQAKGPKKTTGNASKAKPDSKKENRGQGRKGRKSADEEKKQPKAALIQITRAARISSDLRALFVVHYRYSAPQLNPIDYSNLSSPKLTCDSPRAAFKLRKLHSTQARVRVRVRVRCAAVWYVREGGTTWDEGDGEHRVCALAASGSRVERGWGVESDGNGDVDVVERDCLEDAPAGAACLRESVGARSHLRVGSAEFDVVSARSSTMSVRSSKAVALALR
ncbi:hypothetical protein C8F04DRAFT_1272525 [Mycena alexandri]|uniref:Uncharacterized protein n=1 Tax=Mycena alexandri TaxID=1745969 RepID=A0AAD6WT38_9AGAR|nr:hypothetical protein C8F04DRAFT_1272525 [Mycena alexandri]